MDSRVVALAGLFASFDQSAALATDGGTSDRRGGRKYLPSEATEGPRDLAELDKTLGALVRAQPFGRPWSEIVKTDPAPRDRRGLGAAETHAALSRDKMEIQDQAQFLEEIGVAERYGFVSVQALRVYRYGRLTGLQFVLERVGRDPKANDSYAADLAVLKEAWSKLTDRWGLMRSHQVIRNDLEKAAASGGGPGLLFRIELEPRSAPR